MAKNNKTQNESEEIKDEVAEEMVVSEETEDTPQTDEMQKKYDELEDKYLRLAAEYTNFQRRSREEKEALYTNAVADTVSELLPILDNLQRAIDTAQDATDAKTVAEGVEMVMKMTKESLAKIGVSEIEAVGNPFDATLHNAVMHIDDDAYGENEVVEEFQKGYKCKDKVIRYSMVKVAN